MRAGFKGALVSQYQSDIPLTPRDAEARKWQEAEGITLIPGASLPGLGIDRLHYNNNSGAQAINLAFLLGAARIVLLGFDMQWTGGKAHFFGEHPPELSNGNHATFVTDFNQLAKDLEWQGVEVVNCSRQTALHQFPRADLTRTLSTMSASTVKGGTVDCLRHLAASGQDLTKQ